MNGNCKYHLPFLPLMFSATFAFPCPVFREYSVMKVSGTLSLFNKSLCAFDCVLSGSAELRMLTFAQVAFT